MHIKSGLRKTKYFRQKQLKSHKSWLWKDWTEFIVHSAVSKDDTRPVCAFVSVIYPLLIKSPVVVFVFVTAAEGQTLVCLLLVCLQRSLPTLTFLLRSLPTSREPTVSETHLLVSLRSRQLQDASSSLISHLWRQPETLSADDAAQMSGLEFINDSFQ